MFLKAGLVSLLLLLASRVLGLARESAQAAAFGATGLGDVAVLMLSLPDWLTGVLVGGALAYVLLPRWARESGRARARTQRRVAGVMLGAGVALGLALWLGRDAAIGLLAAGLPGVLRPTAASALGWCAMALPAALLAALWATRLQHERDFVGLYGANLVINAVLVLALAWMAGEDRLLPGIGPLGLFLLLAMGLRLVWLVWRQQGAGRGAPAPVPVAAAEDQRASRPAWQDWIWAVLAAALPMVLPFAARSMASQAGEGALTTFNYAWKLVELPLVLAIQLVASLAFPSVATAFASGGPGATAPAVRGAFALAWTLACACAAGLLLGAPALAGLLFGWGRMDSQALERVAAWGAAGAWGLLPQALIAVAMTVLASQSRLQRAVLAYGLALAVFLPVGLAIGGDGASLMGLLNAVAAGVAVALVAAMGTSARWLPGRPLAAAGAALVCVAILRAAWPGLAGLGSVAGLGLAGAAAAGVVAAAWCAGPELRQALRR